MNRFSSLVRRTPLTRTTPLRRQSKKRLAGRRDYEMARGVVWSRDKGLCRLCELGDGCGLGVIDVHHVRPQSRYPELRCDPDNMVLLHRKCHQWAHDHPREAQALGLIK